MNRKDLLGSYAINTTKRKKKTFGGFIYDTRDQHQTVIAKSQHGDKKALFRLQPTSKHNDTGEESVQTRRKYFVMKIYFNLNGK